MARAWRERGAAARVAAARQALGLREDCAPALLLLAEEDAPTVQEVRLRCTCCLSTVVRKYVCYRCIVSH